MTITRAESISGTITSSESILGWNEPAGLTARGTVIVLAGRGESATVYERFGRRISADSWKVRAVDGVAEDPESARRAALEYLADQSLPSPRVLVGSDAGAVLAAQLGSDETLGIDGVVLVGLPTSSSHRSGGEEAELRSACPVHRRTLDDTSLVRVGALAEALPAALTLPAAKSIGVPVLAIHGRADAVAPLVEVLPYYRSLADAEILAVTDGRHDALNDLPHRSVAASLVLWLERLKAGRALVEAVG